MGAQCLFLRLVLQGVSLRGVPRVLAIVSAALGLSLPIPHWTTGRLWLLRLGHALLTMALDKSDDWAWLVDHSVQIGQEKCLVILGIRLRDLPERGECLQHTDLHLVALVPRKSWTRQEVDEELEVASQRTGIPRVIVDDHGVDIAGGVSFFQERHPETVEIYDAKHKAACLLKSRLEKNAALAGIAATDRTNALCHPTDRNVILGSPGSQAEGALYEFGADLAVGRKCASGVTATADRGERAGEPGTVGGEARVATGV